MAITPYEPTLKLNLPEIEEECSFYDDEKNVIYVYCHERDKYEDFCPKCGCFNYVRGGYSYRRAIHDISHGDKSVDILVKQQRYRCKDCGSSFFHPFEFVDPGYWMTKRAMKTIGKQALSQSFTSVAEEYGITIPTVAKLLKEYTQDMEASRVIVAPRVLGIDEVHIGKKMRGVLIDVEKGELLEITENNRIPTIEAAILNMKDYYKNIKVVTMDMANGYKTVVETQLEADVIIDKFHVVRYLYKASVKAKTEILERLKEQVKLLPPGEDKDTKEELLKKLGKDGYLFKYADSRLTPARVVLMKDLCDNFPEIKELYKTKLLAEAIYQCTSPIDSTKAIHNLVDNIPKGKEYEEYRKFGRMLIRWMPEINNYFAHGCKYTNAATEGLNSKIKHLNNVGRGYTYETLRLKCLYCPKVRKEKNLHSRKKPSLPYYEYSWNPGASIFNVLGSSNPNEYNADIQLLVDNFDEIF